MKCGAALRRPSSTLLERDIERRYAINPLKFETSTKVSVSLD
jgi:hypothetical protein